MWMAITENLSNLLNKMAAVQGVKRSISGSDNIIFLLHESLLNVRESYGTLKYYCVVPENIQTSPTEKTGNSRGYGGSFCLYFQCGGVIQKP